MARYTRPTYSTFTAFAAACAAHRINDGYFKQDQITFHDDGNTTVDKLANKTLMRTILNGEHEILDEDRVHAESVIEHCNALSFKILSGKSLSEFEMAMMRISNLETTDSNYDLAVIASLPSTYARAQVRKEQDSRLREARGCIPFSVGEKIKLEIEVVRCNYSNTWETYYVTAITDSGVVFFSSKNAIDLCSKIEIKGKVKAHKEDRTQLSHVKVL